MARDLHEHTDLPREIIDFHVKLKLEAVGLLEHGHKFPSEISGGMKKRVGLARAIAMDPEAVFYDEPTAGLDPIVCAVVGGAQASATSSSVIPFDRRTSRIRVIMFG